MPGGGGDTFTCGIEMRYPVDNENVASGLSLAGSSMDLSQEGPFGI